MSRWKRADFTERNMLSNAITRFVFLVLFCTAYSVCFAQDAGQAAREEESKDHYRQWLKQDVVYIISPEEKSVFEKLTTDEEKEQFIEQFWHRRDPDPRTAGNEFKEEHYRRIAYANDKFTSGDAGWMTDRGRVYILHGPPDSIESRPSGGFYQRDINEGGGTTSTYPFERWRYRHIEGLGDDVVLEFVDTTFTDKFQLAVFPWEKDALLQFPGAGRTLAEQTGQARRSDRAAYMGGGFGPGRDMYSRVKDMPFARYETFAKVQAPPALKYPDLKEVVKVDVRYANLPFDVYEDYFRLNESQVLVPLTIRIRNQNLNFRPQSGYQTARIALYGIITSMTKRIVLEFEDTMITSFREDQFSVGQQKSSMYQKVIPLDARGRYRIDLVLKDLNDGKVGVVQQALIPPAFAPERLVGSSLVVSDAIQPLPAIPDGDQMFVIGDVKVRPNIHRIFSPRMPLGIYFQVYNAALDQSTLAPSLRVTYRLFSGDQLLRQAVDENGESTQFFSPQRIVLMKHLTLEGLDPGKYRIEIEVTDLTRKESVKAGNDFTIVEEKMLALTEGSGQTAAGSAERP